MGFLDKLLGRGKQVVGGVAEKAGDVAERGMDVAGDVAGKAADVAGDVASKTAEVGGRVVEEAGELAGKGKDLVEDAVDRVRGSDEAEGGSGGGGSAG
jgi:uncharacterized protein YjbJ (UPF0337 family)